MKWIFDTLILLGQWYLDYLAGKPQCIRSSRWPIVRHEHLLQEPCCRVCGTCKGLEVHHKKPVHLFPHLELEPSNLITVCREHHYLFGHGLDWKAYNPIVDSDVNRAKEMILHRKYIVEPIRQCLPLP